MTSTTIKTARTTEKEPVIQTISESFHADPAARWMYPAVHQYEKWFPSFVVAFAGKAFDHRSACCAADYSGAALWLPPRVHPDEAALLAHVETSVGAAQRTAVLALFEEMDRHHPAEPHWYLPMIGVAPSKQRSGIGSALLSYMLKICDAEKQLAYLEATSAQSVSLYERHGFVVSTTIEAASSPPLYAMIRTPKPRRHCADAPAYVLG